MPNKENAGPAPAPVFWRVEGSLLNPGAVRPVGFFTWNAQSFAQRWARRGGVLLVALLRPLLYTADREFATRALYALLRGVSQDRLDLLGEEYFEYILKPRLKSSGVEKLKETIAASRPECSTHSSTSPSDAGLVLVSQALDHVMRPLAQYLGVDRLVANRLEFRDGLATGRLLNPVIRPRGGRAFLHARGPDGRISHHDLCRDLGLSEQSEQLMTAITSARRPVTRRAEPIVLFDSNKRTAELSVRRSMAGKHILLIGATGFIGKVWLAKILSDLPEIGKLHLLIRSNRSATAQERFERIVQESPVFDPLQQRYGTDFSSFLSERIEVVDGDITRKDLGIEPGTRSRLLKSLDLVVNSSGLTDFNPDLRTALAINVDATIQTVDFVQQCEHAALLHLSTCYVVGGRDGRVGEVLEPNYAPANLSGFSAEKEYQRLQATLVEIELRSEGPEITDRLRREAIARAGAHPHAGDPKLDSHVRKYRARWIRNEFIEAGLRRAKELGWPNTYTFTKSLAESFIALRSRGVRVAVVRPSIVETSTREPFQGWNEGVNTSAPLSYLLGTYFRQLPSNERKCLDIIPVDLVCRGMTLISAALVESRHEPVYHLATSARNPCDMRRSIELTCLAHRKHYRAQEGFENRLRAKFDSISVSKTRYQKLSAPGQKAVVRAIQRIGALIPFVGPSLVRKERSLDRVEKLIELYEPFILHNQHVFEAGNVELLSQALPAEEQAAFGYDPQAIDWWEYWINIHIPALRVWAYPLIEGRPIESRPRRAFRLVVPSNIGAAMQNTGHAGQ